MKMKQKLHKKVWLCPRDPDTHSYVSYTVGKNGWIDVRVASCERNCDLYFMDTKQGKAKLDRFINVLEEARDEAAKRMVE